MENVFKYRCVRDYCREVSIFLEIEMISVHPVSNYHGEDKKPSVAKNVLSLMALWDIYERGHRHIKRKLAKPFEEDS